MYKHQLTVASNGCIVYVDLISSLAGKYLSRQPYLINVIKEVLEPMKLKGAEISIEQDMGRVIGNTDIVTTSEKDIVIYAQPNKKSVFSRYVKNRSMSPSTQLTILLVQDAERNYEVTNVWIGQYSPPFPGDEKATELSKPYWQSHALILDSQAIQSKTITKICPY